MRRGLMAIAAMADGEPVSFRQDPPLVGADLAGPITLRNFLVVGDSSEVRFMRFDPERAEDDPHIETWTRTGMTTIDGHIVSVFRPSWPDSELARLLQRASYGFDTPFVFWGQDRDPLVKQVRSGRESAQRKVRDWRHRFQRRPRRHR